MRFLDGELVLSATDLTGFAACEHLTQLELRAARGEAERPTRDDPLLDVLSRRGLEHEDRVRAGYADLVEIAVDGSTREGLEQAAAETIDAMRAGVRAIYQATFLHDGWVGHADFLERVDDLPSELDDWSYEAADAKLARSVKPAAILQLCSYSEHVERVQGATPRSIHVLTGDGQRHTLRLADYAAYYRALKRRFEAAVRTTHDTYPEQVDHCSICRWNDVCTEQWRADDDLSLVARMRHDQARRLRAAGVPTRAALAAAAPETEVDGIGDAAFERLRAQARLQVRGDGVTPPLYELLEPVEPSEAGGPLLGLLALPRPSDGDLFFDIEGDPYALDTGLEYLFGIVEIVDGEPVYHAFWAHDREGEQSAFEQLIDFVVERRARLPDLHVYHYAAYELSAVRRLMSRYGTREAEVDDLLRGEVFVDLYRVVRHTVRLSTESYSLKEVETLYRERPEGAVMDAAASIVAYERYLDDADPKVLDEIARYNEADCTSLVGLRDWLEARRIEAEERWGSVDRPPEPDAALSAERLEVDAELAELAALLSAGVPEDPAARGPEQQATWLLAQLLQWHRREDKPQWWAYFHRVRDLAGDDFVDDNECIGGLELVGPVRTDKQSIVHRYEFEPQDHKFRVGDDPIDPARGAPAGEIVRIGDDWVELKRGPSLDSVAHPTALIPGRPWGNLVLREAIRAVGEWVTGHGIDAPGAYRAVREVLLCRPPRLRHSVPGAPVARPEEEPLEAACRLVHDLEQGCLPVQGPPGSGKTFTGAHMIVELVDAGCRVGITSHTHSAIANLLDEACKCAEKRGVAVRAVQKAEDDQACRHNSVTTTTNNEDVETAVADDEVDVVAGTAWLWARPAMRDAVDVLFVDEAGQMSLANVVAVSGATASIVLLGDPQQLAQPSQGVHPEGAGASALGHLLGDHPTIPDDFGLFLDRTYRMHPDVCRFVSEVAYESRLTSAPGRDLQTVDGEAALRFVPVEHAANRVRSAEEAEVVAGIVEELVGRTCRDYEGAERTLVIDDVIVIAPYNAQVAELRRHLPDGARVGTVDKFQGREGVVAIYSMASSSAEDAPRSVSFLYDLHRFNVAVSRARAQSIVVCNPALLRVLARTPYQMRLPNALCRYVELAGALTTGSAG